MSQWRSEDFIGIDWSEALNRPDADIQASNIVNANYILRNGKTYSVDYPDSTGRNLEIHIEADDLFAETYRFIREQALQNLSKYAGYDYQQGVSKDGLVQPYRYLFNQPEQDWSHEERRHWERFLTDECIKAIRSIPAFTVYRSPDIDRENINQTHSINQVSTDLSQKNPSNYTMSFDCEDQALLLAVLMQDVENRFLKGHNYQYKSPGSYYYAQGTLYQEHDLSASGHAFVVSSKTGNVSEGTSQGYGPGALTTDAYKDFYRGIQAFEGMEEVYNFNVFLEDGFFSRFIDNKGHTQVYSLDEAILNEVTTINEDVDFYSQMVNQRQLGSLMGVLIDAREDLEQTDLAQEIKAGNTQFFEYMKVIAGTLQATDSLEQSPELEGLLETVKVGKKSFQDHVEGLDDDLLLDVFKAAQHYSIVRDYMLDLHEDLLAQPKPDLTSPSLTSASAEIR